MIEDVTMSGSLVKSQQIGEAELTVGQRGVELLHQYRSRPLVFMERYHVRALKHILKCHKSLPNSKQINKTRPRHVSAFFMLSFHSNTLQALGRL